MKYRAVMLKLIAILAALMGIIVMYGWFFEIDALKSIVPGFVTMKFTTAFSFVLSGWVLYLVVINRAGRITAAQAFLPIPSLIIVILMTTMIISSLTGIRTGIEELFVKEGRDALFTSVPGRPSMGTMFNFLLVVAAGLCSMINMARLGRVLKIIGCVMCAVSGVSLLGYAINQPVLYFVIGDFSTGMAIHTTVLFLIIGFALTEAAKITYEINP